MASSSSGGAGGAGGASGAPEVKIHNVYMSNVEEEFARIRGFVEVQPIV